MKNSRKIILISLALLFFIILLLIIKKTTSHHERMSKIVVLDELSINYLNGDKLSSASNKKNKYVFSVTNNAEVEKYYKIEIDDFKENENLKYQLTSEETNLKITDEAFTSKTLVDYVVINPGDTHNYELVINKSISKFNIGKLTVDRYTFEQEYFAQTVIANSSISQNSKTVVGMETSQNDEGLIQDLDDDGVTYYFRGNVQNNYVKFADKLWRIVRINGNNTVRLVLNDATEDTAEYYIDNSNNYFAYANTNIKSYLSSWYNENLSEFDKYIASSKVCDDSAYTGSDEYIFNASQRLSVDHNPTFNCLGTRLNSKISILTADEVEYAGALIGVGNNSYYLYNSNILNPVWTMTPSKGNEKEFHPYTISTSGSLEDSSVGNQKKSVRPVINIKKDLSVVGKGTIDEPYELLF